MEITNLIIDSARRDTSAYPTTSAFIYKTKLIPNIRIAKLRNFAIYNSEYTVNSKNNTFTLNDGANYTITLTQGNYTATGLAVELQTRLNAYGGAVTFTVVNNTTTCKYIITSSGPVTFTFDKLCAKLLGFGNTSVGTVHTSINCYKVASTSVIYICIDEFRANQAAPVNYFAAVVNNVGTGELLTHEKSYYHTICPLGSTVFINQLTVRMLDENYRELELNNIDFVLDIELC